MLCSGIFSLSQLRLYNLKFRYFQCFNLACLVNMMWFVEIKWLTFISLWFCVWLIVHVVACSSNSKVGFEYSLLFVKTVSSMVLKCYLEILCYWDWMWCQIRVKFCVQVVLGFLFRNVTRLRLLNRLCCGLMLFENDEVIRYLPWFCCSWTVLVCGNGLGFDKEKEGNQKRTKREIWVCWQKRTKRACQARTVQITGRFPVFTSNSFRFDSDAPLNLF